MFWKLSILIQFGVKCIEFVIIIILYNLFVMKLFYTTLTRLNSLQRGCK